MVTEYSERVAALRKKTVSVNLDALLVTAMPNVRYLSGFTGSSAFVLLTRNNAFFYTDFRYCEQALEEVPHLELREERGKRENVLKSAVTKHSIRSLGFEPSVSYRFYQSLLRTGTELFALDNPVEKLREIKSPHEIELIRTAIRRAESAFIHVKPFIRPGKTEISVARMLEDAVKKEGCRSVPFEIIIASGKNASMPHAHPTEKKIQRGDFVIIDWGGEAGGYHSDMTRTLLMSEPVAGEKEHVYRIVNEAREKAIAAIGPGVKASDIDRAARRHIADAGYDKFFGHGTGHGIGVETHEAPRISRINRKEVRTGMVFSIEPGIYLPGVGGVRIEDLVLVKEGASEVLTSLPRSLEIV